MTALKTLATKLKDAVWGAICQVMDKEAVLATGVIVSGIVAIAGSAGIVIPAASATAIVAPLVGAFIARFFVYSKHTLKKQRKL